MTHIFCYVLDECHSTTGFLWRSPMVGAELPESPRIATNHTSQALNRL